MVTSGSGSAAVLRIVLKTLGVLIVLAVVLVGVFIGIVTYDAVAG